MRFILFLFYALFTSQYCNAQIDTKLIDYNNKLEVELEKETSSQSFADKFNSVNVIDLRDDTGAVGYYYITKLEAFKHGIKPGDAEKRKNNDALSKIYYCAPTLKDGLGEWVNTYLQCGKNVSVKNKLLIAVKKFWLSAEADKIEFENEKKGQALNGWDAGLLCKLEFYLERDSIFYPLYKVDSIFTFKEKLNDFTGPRFVDNSGFFITSALQYSLSKLASINQDEIIAKRRKLLLSDINAGYLRKNDLQIFKSASFKKGAYKNFEEFKSNAPSISNYELREGIGGDIVYVKEGENEYPTRELWGFCDGINIFINSGDKYSKLIRKENTFYFFGTKGIVQKSKHISGMSSGLNYAMNTGPKTAVYKMDPKYFQIDMETGEVY